MKTLSKTLLASALFTAGVTGFTTAQAIEVSIGGEIAVEWTDAESSEDLSLEVTTTDLVVTAAETIGELEVEAYAAFAREEVNPSLDDEDESVTGLAQDGAGITVSGGFGSLFVGDDGTGVFVGDGTDVMYNNSEAFFADPTTNVINYGLPLGDDVSLNIFLDSTSGDDEDIDAFGFYGSYSTAGVTFALGYTDLAGDGAYGASGQDDDILDVFVGYEGGENNPIAAGIAYQDQDSVTDEIIAGFLSYTTGPIVLTAYAEDAGDAGDLVSFNATYNFSDNFYAFFETASYENDADDNSEVGLVVTF